MLRQRTFYDPIVQTDQPELPTTVVELPPLPGLLIEKPGPYFHVETVCFAIRHLAGQIAVERPESASDLLALADSFAGIGSEQPTAEVPPPVPAEDPPAPPPVPEDPAVARVEVYPDAEGKWYARPVDATGTILSVTDGSFDKEFVIADAAWRWHTEIHELPDAMMDSIWNEQHAALGGAGFNSRRRPSPKRLFP